MSYCEWPEEEGTGINLSPSRCSSIFKLSGVVSFSLTAVIEVSQVDPDDGAELPAAEAFQLHAPPSSLRSDPHR